MRVSVVDANNNVVSIDDGSGNLSKILTVKNTRSEREKLKAKNNTSETSNFETKTEERRHESKPKIEERREQKPKVEEKHEPKPNIEERHESETKPTEDVKPDVKSRETKIDNSQKIEYIQNGNTFSVKSNDPNLSVVYDAGNGRRYFANNKTFSSSLNQNTNFYLYNKATRSYENLPAQKLGNNVNVSETPREVQENIATDLKYSVESKREVKQVPYQETRREGRWGFRYRTVAGKRDVVVDKKEVSFDLDGKKLIINKNECTDLKIENGKVTFSSEKPLKPGRD